MNKIIAGNDLLEKAIDTYQKGRVGEAMLLFQKVLEQDEHSAEAHYNLATIYFILNRPNDAFPHFKTAYELNNEDADYIRGYGLALYTIGDLSNSEHFLRKSLEKQPDSKDALEYLVKILLNSGRMHEVIMLLEPHLNNANKKDQFLYSYCQALIGLGDHAKALSAMRDHVDNHKKSPQHLRLLGAIYLQLSMFDEAVIIMRKVAQLQPEEIGNWSNLCAACKGAYLFDEGIKAAEKALTMDPEHFDSLANLGVIYREKGEPEKGLEYINRALELRPAYQNTLYNRGLNRVAGGYLREGWADSEYRWQTAQNNVAPRPTLRPMWDGSDIGDKTLCLFTDQGVGDSIQFCRLFPEVFKRCPNAKIILRCEKKLIPLMRDTFGERMDYIVLDPNELIMPMDFDVHAPVATLLDILKIDIDMIDPKAYLTAPAPLNYRDNPDQKIIGISWYTKNIQTGYKRSLDLKEFLFLKDLPNVKIINLQYGDTSAARAEAKALGLNVFNDESVDAWGDLQPFLNQVAACDLVISIDNTTVHTAGALGVPVWTITPYIAYWRWCLHNEKSPWYESMRFFQQTQPGKYDDVLHRIKTDAQKWLAGDTDILRPETFEPPVKPYSQRITKKQVLLIGAPDPLAAMEDQISGHALVSELERNNYDVLPCVLRELEDTQVAPPKLIDFDSTLYATEWRYKNPSLMDRISRADHVIINGGQSIHGLTPLTCKILYLAYYAKFFAHKKVSILNHTCYPEDSVDLTDANIVAFYRKVYKLCDDISVTEPLSQHILNQLQIPVRLVSDASQTLSLLPSEQTKNNVIALIHGMTLNKKAELLGQIGSMLSSQNLSLSLLVYSRDKKGRDEAGQIKSLLAPLPCSVNIVDDQNKWVEEISKAGTILTNHFSVMAISLALSKKLLTLPATLPYIEGLGHMAGLALSSAEEISNIRALAPASWPSIDENGHLLSPVQINF